MAISDIGTLDGSCLGFETCVNRETEDRKTCVVVDVNEVIIDRVGRAFSVAIVLSVNMFHSKIRGEV